MPGPAPLPYDRARVRTGIVHFGPGAFHRAHQADYLNRLVAEDPRWGVAAVSLRSPGTVEALRRQEGIYTLAILDAEPAFRTIGVHRAFYGPGEGEAVRHLLADPGVAVVTTTVTEKGYCLGADSTLDFAHPDIVHDLAHPEAPDSIVGWLARGLADRRERGLVPFATICCDNLSRNGSKLRQAVVDYAARLDPALAAWIGGEARFPETMVDSITPATDEAVRRRVREATGFDDAIPVSREAYAAWVIEDALPPGGPDLAAAGAILTSDVAGWERAKLRILNGAHSTLAYLGLLIGHDTVAEAMEDAVLAGFVERLIRSDIVPTLEPSPLDLHSYAAEILARFRNPAIRHRLAQIAWDGSQKLPYRLLDTLADARAAGRPIHRLALPVAAWILFVERQARAGAEIVDPLGAELARIGTAPEAPRRLLGLRQIFPAALVDDPEVGSAILGAAEELRAKGVRALLAEGEGGV